MKEKLIVFSVKENVVVTNFISTRENWGIKI